jgi:8-oxo-dGTP pyrophosphatase MutT (NUDIX family)
MSFTQFISTVSKALSMPLPGFRAQRLMSSMKRVHELMGVVSTDKAKPSSVLLLFYPVDGEACMVFIQRPDYGGVHSGQISFPGGKREPGDLDLEATALRESMEEVGVEPDKVKILGRLSDLYIPPSRYLVSPFVGYYPERPDFKKDPEEVQDIIEVRVRDLLSENSYQVTKHKVGLGIQIKAPAFVINGHVIWGATAMILSEFKEMIKEYL